MTSTTIPDRDLLPRSLSDLDPLLTVHEAARLCRVTRRTIQRWAEDGRIATTRPVAAGRGRRLVLRDSLLAFLGLMADPAR